MAWRRRGDKPLSEPMMAWFTDAFVPLDQDGLIELSEEQGGTNSTAYIFNSISLNEHMHNLKVKVSQYIRRLHERGTTHSMHTNMKSSRAWGKRNQEIKSANAHWLKSYGTGQSSGISFVRPSWWWTSIILYQAWECIVMKKTENILQGGTPKKIVAKIDTFDAFWCKLTIMKMILWDLKKRKSVKKTENSHACYITAWYWTNDKPLSNPILAHLTDRLL